MTQDKNLHNAENVDFVAETRAISLDESATKRLLLRRDNILDALRRLESNLDCLLQHDNPHIRCHARLAIDALWALDKVMQSQKKTKKSLRSA